MNRLMVYSHDTYTLGNIRRMLAICHHLLESIPDLSILLMAGSPMIESFRLSERLDYIKLPSLIRTDSEAYSVKSLGTGIDETMRLRSELLTAACMNFRPDVFLVDKKPYGVKNELATVIRTLRQLQTGLALVLRDILDAPEKTVSTWRANEYYEASLVYDLILVLGSATLFDVTREYCFPRELARKTRFCGYLRTAAGPRSVGKVRSELQVSDGEKLVVLTVGGGEDGFKLLSGYAAGSRTLARKERPRTLMICGREMNSKERQTLLHQISVDDSIQMLEFTDDVMSYLAASDLIVSTGGYNTVCDILSTGRRAIVVPCSTPVEEQRIRAERMSQIGLFHWIPSNQLTPARLIETVMANLRASPNQVPDGAIDLDGLPHICRFVDGLLESRRPTRTFQRSVASAAVLQGVRA